jgi:hypothetical protein
MKKNQIGYSSTKSIHVSLEIKKEVREQAKQERGLLVDDHLSAKDKQLISGRKDWTDFAREQEAAQDKNPSAFSP